MKSSKRIDRIDEIKLLVEAVLVGLLSGLIIVFYRYVLHFIEDNLFTFKDIIVNNRIYIFLFFLIMIGLGYIAGYIRKIEPLCAGSGIPQVEAEMTGYINQNPLRVLITKIFGGFVCGLGGLSVGREGPSIQIGAMCGKIISKVLKRKKTTERYLLTCGAGAGLAAAFNAPMAGIIFAIEEVHRHISKKLLITCLTSCIVADFISKLFFGIDPIFRFNVVSDLALSEYWIIVLLAITLAFSGILYTSLMKKFIFFYERTNINIVLRPILPFFIAAILFFVLPEVIGGGSMVMDVILTNNISIKFIILLFIVKLLFSMFSFNAGVPGGIFFPILVMGATVGASFANIFGKEYLSFFIIVSMAGFLTAIVRAPLTAIILIFEMTGSIKFLLPLTLVCLITYAITNYLRIPPIYDYLLENLLKKNNIEIDESNDRMIINVNVQPGCKAENKFLKHVELPKNILVTKIERVGQDIIPNGETKLNTNDMLSILIYNYENTHKEIEEINNLFSADWRQDDRN